MRLMCIWNGIYLCWVSGLPVSIFVAPVAVFHHGLCHHCHNLQPDYHLLCKTHLLCLWIFCPFFIETCPLWVLLQTVIFYICTCQIGTQMLWWYDDLSSSLRLWYPELASIWQRYFMFFNFGKISLSVGPLWTGLMSTWFSLGGSKHSLTFQLGLGMRTKLLYHSAVSSMPSGVMMSCCWNLPDSSLNSFCNAYAMCLRGAWYGLLSRLAAKKCIPSKHLIPLKCLQNPFVVDFLFQHLLLCHFFG